MTTTLEETTSAWELDHDASRTTRTVGDIWRVTQRRPHTPEQAHLALLMANDAPPQDRRHAQARHRATHEPVRL